VTAPSRPSGLGASARDTLRIWRSAKSWFGPFEREPDPWKMETVTALDAYTDEILAGIAGAGFNAVWVHGDFNHVVRTTVLPELGRNADLHQERMNELVRRAKRHGVRIMMYVQPLRALPRESDFWKAHPDLAGQPEVMVGDDGEEVELWSLCPSTETIRRFLVEASAELARKVPGLGGLIMITASEYPAHCWARRGHIMLSDGSRAMAEMECPRCRGRNPSEVVVEILHKIRDGVRSVRADMPIIAWNWSWSFYEPIPCAGIINELPRDVILMADFERGGHKVIHGKDTVIDEYSLGFAGPSRQFTESYDLARHRGLEVMAKLQFGTTHELATVPNLPVLGNVVAKAQAVRRLGLAGFMGCWNIGNSLSANTTIFNAALAGHLPEEIPAALAAFAAEYFPGCDASKAAAAWQAFAGAMDHYPFSTVFVYSGPANFSFLLPVQPGPLSGKSMGRSWMLDERGDDFGPALVGTTVDETLERLEALATIWANAMPGYREALRNGEAGPHAAEELRTAEICGLTFRSLWNHLRIYRLRKAWSPASGAEYFGLVRAELEVLRAALPILLADPRFGYHSEARGYQYDADRVAHQIAILESQVRE
jgi:hypothetical protein